MTDATTGSLSNAAKTTLEQNKTILPQEAKNSTEMVGYGEDKTSTKDITEALVKVFPAGMQEGTVISRLMTTYHIDRETAKACYDAAIDEVVSKNNLTKSELQNNASALVSGEDKKKDGMDNLNAWGDYNKMMMGMDSSASTQGGD